MVAEKDKDKFRSCAKNAFCSLHRTRDDPEPIVMLDKSQLECNGTQFKAPLKILDITLDFWFYITESGAMRVQIDEKTPRWKPPGVFVEGGICPVEGILREIERNDTHIHYMISERTTVEVRFNPFKFTMLKNEKPVVVVNGFEELYYRTDEVIKSTKSQITKDGKDMFEWGEDGKPIFAPGEEVVEEIKDDDESSVLSLSGTGNELGVDIAFVDSKGLFGIPERTTPLLLPNTKGVTDPYRLYNLDVFGYEIGESMGLYGNVPIMVSKGALNNTTGIFWNNPSDTYVDLSDEELLLKGEKRKVRKSKWMSEAGNFDLLIFLGDDLSKTMKQIRDTTGPQILPPMFSLGYHQCRWDYDDQEDILSVNQGFEKHNIPMDVIWLDIGHTDGRRYFTFDKKRYPDPLAMYKEIDSYGRKAVNIVDPHIKRDEEYMVHQISAKEGYYLKDRDGNDFEGWCWPGSSSYIDFSHEPARKFWASMFDTEKYKDTINGVVHIWNDMNEPAVFNTEEVTMPKDCKNVEGVDFREQHNLWGMLFHSSSQAGLLHRDLAEQKLQSEGLVWRNLHYNEEQSRDLGKDITLQRGFVLSRAFYAGTQRAGAIWTGDNTADWANLEITVPMLLSLGMAGISFVGADVGGFFGDPSPELLVRWYQAACLQPFFRGHGHIDTKRREPWLFGEESTKRIREAIEMRYRLLPYIYSTFYTAERTGMPVMRPMFMNFPDDDDLLVIENQWMIGESLLVSPVLNEGAKSREVVFPTGEWCSVTSFEMFTEGKTSFQVDLDTKLAFFRAGYIVPMKERVKKSTAHMKQDPYTFIVVLGESQIAEGELYIDDETTYNYADKSAFCKVSLQFQSKKLTAKVALGNPQVFNLDVAIEKIMIIGYSGYDTVKNKRIMMNDSEIDVEVTSSGNIIIRPPSVKVTENFEFSL